MRKMYGDLRNKITIPILEEKIQAKLMLDVKSRAKWDS